MYPSTSAASSHKANDAYMTRFEAALDGNTTESCDTRGDSDGRGALTECPSGAPVDIPLPHRRTTSICHDPSVSLDVSERLLVCSSLEPGSCNTLAIGSTDHAVYTIDLSTKKLKQTLHTPAYGHSEWVTCVTHTPDGRVVSGGMDGKLCLWSRDAVTCRNAIGHKGSVSGLGCLGGAMVSCGYDKTVRIWNNSHAKQMERLEGHQAPVLLLVPGGSELVATGDRGGSVFVWNLSTAELEWRLKNIHKGHITAIQWIPAADTASRLFFTGGQDGILRLWDIRDHSNLAKESIHASPTMTAAINDIHIADHYVITAGADKTLKVIDRRKDYGIPVVELPLPCFPYSSIVSGGVVFCSCGDGSLTLVDLKSLSVLDMFPTSLAAMRFMHVHNGQLICGDDSGRLSFHSLQQTAAV